MVTAAGVTENFPADNYCLLRKVTVGGPGAVEAAEDFTFIINGLARQTSDTDWHTYCITSIAIILFAVICEKPRKFRHGRGRHCWSIGRG